MKKILSVCILALSLLSTLSAATYTYSGSGDPGVLTNWNNTVGGGNPSNFTTANDVFNFPTGTNAAFSTGITLGAVTFNLQGTATVNFSSNITMIATAAIAKVIVGDNTGSATATIPSTVTISGQTSTIYVAWQIKDASTLYYGTASTFYPFTGTPGSPTSNIVFNGTAAQTILNNTTNYAYGNIELNNTAGLTGGGFQTYYNVTLTRGTITAPRTCAIKGNVYRNGTTQTGSYNLGSATTLTFSGTTAQTVDASGLNSANTVVINNAQGVTVNTGTLTARAGYTFTSGVLTMASGTGLTLGTSSTGVTFAGTPGAGNQIDATQATVTLSGSTGYTLPANSFVNNTVRNLTVNTKDLATNVTLNNNLIVNNTLTFTSGTLVSNGFLNVSSATVTSNSANAYTIPANSFVNNTIKNLRVNNNKKTLISSTDIVFAPLGVLQVDSIGNSTDILLNATGQNITLDNTDTLKVSFGFNFDPSVGTSITLANAALITGSFYTNTVNITKGNTTYLASISYPDNNKIVITITGLLPLNLLGFNASKIETGIKLNWLTANEFNTSHFIIERSINGLTDFIQVGNVVALGSGNNTYSYVDINPLAGNNYYRLVCFDKNGSFTYSKILVARKDASSVLKLQVTPNPSVSNFIVTYPKSLSGSAIKISTTSGQVLKYISLAEGSTQISIARDFLQSGTYIVTLTNGSKAESCFLMLQ